MRSEEIRKEMNREQNIAFCRMLFPPTKGQFSFKKKNLLRKGTGSSCR